MSGALGVGGERLRLTKQNYNATDQTKSVLDHEQMRTLMRRDYPPGSRIRTP
jgi:hypothetical protein